MRCHSRQKNGKQHRYWSVVESRRWRGGRPVQQQVLYLGEIIDSHHGSLDVESRLVKGTTFRIFLPASQGE